MLTCEGLNLTRPLGIIQKRDVSMSRAARSFIELIIGHAIWTGDSNQEELDPNSHSEPPTGPIDPSKTNVLADAASASP
jgi:hypothetical protein